MKTIPPPCPEPESGQRYWRSLDQLAETPEFRQFVEREFPSGASELTDPVTRRHFVKIMSASFLLAGFGLTGCRRPEERILPFAKAPEGYIHGVPQHFATAMPTRGSAIPLVARSNDGRPTKVEGNALHPSGNGGTNHFAQASVLNLYDPDRATRYLRAGNASSKEGALDALAAAGRQSAAKGGQGLAFLMERSSSPSRARLQKALQAKLPSSRWFVYEPLDNDIHRLGATTAFGSEVRPHYHFNKAQVILSLDGDFLGDEDESYLHIRGFSQGRKLKSPSDSLNRLYQIEALFTLTGMNADHRLRVPASQVLPIAARVAIELFSQTGVASPLAASLQPIAATAKVDAKWVTECAKDLAAHKGHAVVFPGVRQPLAVHVIAHAINHALGAIGTTVTLLPAAKPAEAGIEGLAQALKDGSVETLVILGGNPAYNAPVDLALARGKATVLRLGYYEDETAAWAEWHFPAAHYLESWGDARTADGTLVPVQPLIEPLFGGITEIEFLSRFGGLDRTRAHDIVRDTFTALSGQGEEGWKRFLHDGFLAGSAPAAVTGQVDARAIGPVLAAARPAEAPSSSSLEVVFHGDYSLDDGRYNNNGWLQELPDPITKMVWENVILLSQKTADALNLKIKDKEDMNLQVPIVKVTLGSREVEGPAWVQPGMADNVLALALGYGRTKTGRIGQGSGYNAYTVRTASAPFIASGAKLVDTGRVHPLATTQNHWAMEGRPIVREANLEQYKKHPDFAKGMNMHEPPGPRDAQGRPASLYPNPLDVPDKDGKSPRERAVHAWGMSIDLNACVGCTACVVACQSENNIPIVGKDQVSRNREMHWIRIDRYYAGSIEDPQAVTQPMLCQHCEAAPCESVCPVNATAHDEEGLNVMAYNRCVGTRYCSNNCPYKVRRFNYFDYNKRNLADVKGPVYPTPLLHSTEGEWDMIRWFKNPDKGMRTGLDWELLKLAKNPDVTVRMRGIMEKCTFCLQRIEQAKIAQKVKAGASGDVEVPDGTIKTACQQACPADAIVFGNIKDPQSEVSKLKALDRDYTVLEFLLTKPRTTYLARVRNPNPGMPDYRPEPETFKAWEQKGNHLDTHAGAGHGGHGETSGAAHGSEKKGAH